MFLGTGHARCPEFLSATLQDHIIKGYFGAGDSRITLNYYAIWRNAKQHNHA